MIIWYNDFLLWSGRVIHARLQKPNHKVKHRVYYMKCTCAHGVFLCTREKLNEQVVSYSRSVKRQLRRQGKHSTDVMKSRSNISPQTEGRLSPPMSTCEVGAGHLEDQFLWSRQHLHQILPVNHPIPLLKPLIEHEWTRPKQYVRQRENAATLWELTSLATSCCFSKTH